MKTDEAKDKDRRGLRTVTASCAKKASPLDVEGVDLGVTTDEIVSMIREGRGAGMADTEPANFIEDFVEEHNRERALRRRGHHAIPP